MEDKELIKYYILVDKKPVVVDLFEWAEWFGKEGNRIVNFDIIQKEGEEITISTVFVGMDMSMPWEDADKSPLLFETMVFGDKEEGIDRYKTYSEALIGHQKMVNRILIEKEDGKN